MKSTLTLKLTSKLTLFAYLCLSSCISNLNAQPIIAHKPLGNPQAPRGGTFRIRLPGEPPTLNPIISDGSRAAEIDFYVIEPLLWINEQTGHWQRALADDWKVIKGHIFEFHLRSGVKWSDGVPLTADDVKFSFDVLFDDHFPTAHMRPYYDQLEKVEVVAHDRVRFYAKDPYFGNFISSAGLPIVPKHIYGDPQLGPKIHHQLIGTGPYVVEKFSRGRSVTLKRNLAWWGWRDPLYAGKHKPEKIVFQFVSDDNVAFEMLRKGDLDYMDLGAEFYERVQKEAGFERTFFARQVHNLYPQTVSSIGFNLQNPLFRDRRVRLALAHLVDRKMMIQKFFRGNAELATGPWYRQSQFADPGIEPFEFDPKKALSILRQSGWSDSDHNQVLDKMIDGKKVELRFTIITARKEAERYLTVLKEDAKQAGVDISIRVLGGGPMAIQLDAGKYEAADMSWGGGLVEFDPKPGWHSASGRPGGMNLVRYQNTHVDELIEKARQIYDPDKRRPVMREIYRKIANDIPHLFLFNNNSFYYAYSRFVDMPVPTFDYDIGLKYWWVKPENPHGHSRVHTAQAATHAPDTRGYHAHHIYNR